MSLGDTPAVLAIGGLSECGKSTVGKYLAKKGVPRLKIVTFLQAAHEASGTNKSFQEWAYESGTQQANVLAQFVATLKGYLIENHIQLAGLESLYDPLMAKVLKESFGPANRIIYIDIPDELRIVRQAGRLGIDDLETARAHLEPRDADKIAWGALEIKELADVVIDNSGSLEDLYRHLDALLAEVS